MEKDRFPLSTSREPNPLRPYYVPPSIGPATSATPGNASRSAASSSLSSSARDFMPDIDLDLKSTTSEAWQQTRTLCDTLVWRYTSILLAQPFDVSKTLLQVSLPPSSTALATPKRKKPSPRRTRSTAEDEGHRRGTRQGEEEETDEGDFSDRSDDMPDYFSSAAPRSRSPRKRRRVPPSPGMSPSPTPTPRDRKDEDLGNEYKLNLKRPDSISHTISALYNTSGAVGLWRSTNCTFLYSILLRTTDSFVRSLLLALVGLPEIVGPDSQGLGPSVGVAGAGFSGLDLSASPNPIGSLIIVGLSSCIAGLLLTPLELVRTRLVVAPTSHPPRGLLQNMRRLPSILAPSDLWLPTALYHSVPQVFSAACPLFLRRQLRITPELTPSLWSLTSFMTSLTDLLIRLPFETVLRRAQVTTLRQHEPDMPVIIEPASYTGVWSTIYGIIYQEGETTTRDAKGMIRVRRGQGASGLIRGWRIGFWGLAGIWTASAMGPGEGKTRGEF